MQESKRDPALQDLSNDHQRVLLQVRNIRWLLDGDERADPQPEVLARFMRFWGDHGLPHLREEEQFVYPIYAELEPEGAAQIEQLIADHDWLRYRIAKLAAEAVDVDSPRLLDMLDEITTRLEEHVRFEERVLLDRLQELMTPEAMLRLGERTLKFRKEWRSDEVITPRDDDDDDEYDES